jgi:GNAT superfamily N-acetyltransferase
MGNLEFFEFGSHPGWDMAPGMVERAYPEFMNHDPVANRGFPLMYEMYPSWQRLGMDGSQVVGFLNSVPLPFLGDDDLPEEGWDWAMEAATRRLVTESTVACGIQIVIDPDLHGQGYARAMVSHMKETAAAHGCDRLYVPIRPTRKSEYPTESMREYAQRVTEGGEPFDPWQQVHVSLGAKVIGPCDLAMVISGTVAEWEEWTGLGFDSDGEVTVPGALAPVTVDIEADLITYVEPNLWLRHDLEVLPTD